MMEKTLVVYYSRVGRTRRVAEDIANRLGADLAEIRLAEPSDDDFDEVVDYAQESLRSNARPAIVALECDFEDYKTVVVGSPVWRGTFAPAVGTFFDEYDLDNMKVCPFITDQGDPGHALEDMGDACPNSEVMGGLEVCFEGNEIQTDETVVRDWVANIQRSLLSGAL